MTDKGFIFNIQPYSIHDGPGIRTTFFVKGCPLHCRWCHNPESQSVAPQLMFYEMRCIGCGICASECLEKAIEIINGKAKTDRNKCTDCGKCTDTCKKKARELVGREEYIRDLVKKAMSDKIFYDESKGGVTVSGGEPLSQPEFVLEFFRQCKEKGLHVTLDTCGYAVWEKAEPVFKEADLILFDIKHIDPEEHRKLTGVSNRQILENLVKVHNLGKNVYIRIPIIPGMNDDENNIRSTARFVKEKLNGEYKVFLLPYHSLGNSKLENMERTDGMLEIEPPSDEHMQELKKIFEEYEIEVQIGG